MRYGVAVVLFFVVAAGVIGTQPVGAEKPIFAQFQAMYVKPKSADRTMQIFKEAVEKKQCTICHLPKPQKGFNAYGTQVKSLITKRDAQNPQAVRAALKRVEAVKSADDPKSQTYGQRLRQGKLPVGEIHVRPAAGASNSASAAN
jgi:hypothetical protein